ncbi:MAG: hypothetical protein KDH94_04475, partial [Coxiellaceae bacterium]|nr:hypothetical protein [Coxiellaceae bacterium]
QLTQNDLKPGDIMFTLDAHGVPGHAAIWAPTEGSLRPLAHAMNRNGANTMTKTGIMPDKYVVFRPKDELLAQLAADIANHWCCYNTRYDERRLQVGERLYGARMRDQASPEAAKKAAYDESRKAFDQSGRYRMVKYASRRLGPINLPEGIGNGRGVWCAMFALLCYQTAAMTKAGLVEPIVGGDKYPWTSDKYTDINLLSAYGPGKPTFFSMKELQHYAQASHQYKQCMQSYSAHVEKTRSINEFENYKHYHEHKRCDQSHQIYPPSIVAWDFQANGYLSTFDFEKVLSTGLMLEQKTIDLDIFMYALAQDTKMWSSPGVVVIESKSLSQEERQMNKEEKQFRLDNAFKMRLKMVSYLQGNLQKLPTYDKDIAAEKALIHQPKP